MKANAAVAVAAAAVLGTAGAARAIPEVTGVTMAQRDNSRIVDIGYTLSGEEAIVTLSIETNGVAIQDGAVTRLAGDVCKMVRTGARSIVWNAGDDWPEHTVTNARARVTAWQTNAPPPYCAVDLTGGSGTNFYPVTYYASVEALPYGGLTNAIYKSSYLVMRRIDNGAFNMGDGVCAVTLTKNFYAGVFEVTQGQWYQVMGTKPSNFTDASSWLYRPVEKVSYDDIRGSSAQGGGGWPMNDNVYATSFIGRLRTRTGLAGFDLPTEAQWEYTCRGGTVTCFSDGNASANVSGANANTNAWLDALGRYRYDGGYADDVTSPATNCAPANGTAAVGSYLPNAWGLYDMHGNVWEWCLDWYGGTLEGGVDPDGADTDYRRVAKGGGWDAPASSCRSASRYGGGIGSLFSSIGLRLFRVLP